jgi:hypothetical protein
MTSGLQWSNRVVLEVALAKVQRFSSVTLLISGMG